MSTKTESTVSSVEREMENGSRSARVTVRWVNFTGVD
jgi:hypothetical protein